MYEFIPSWSSYRRSLTFLAAELTNRSHTDTYLTPFPVATRDLRQIDELISQMGAGENTII